ncbi:testis-expressed protein 47 [Mastacembelus armatus]|uniref:Testis expressed 47 n=1 Tax=Mastacembelus armatus TaxID=205130 RepID=A0A7N8YHL0_9TELE|nr:testis-expressed protein 47 [Mastacembelus armatus]XP_026171688.1 testis-expressed protein 47 [Mastacembelus armatus]
MAASLKSENRRSELKERNLLMSDEFHGETSERIVLQRLVVIARLPHNADRTELRAHYEQLIFDLSKQYIWDLTTGLLLIYPSCLLHIVESSRDILVSVLKDLKDMQHTGCILLESPKVVFMAHNPERRLFQQWSHKVLGPDHVAQGWAAKGLQEEDDSIETLVCTVLSELQRLRKHLEIAKKALPGLALDETPELIISPRILEKLLSQDELQTPEQYLQMYDAPLNISMDFGQVVRSRSLTTV